MARVDIDALAATEVYDECRDAAYDELVVPWSRTWWTCCW